jgi:hypothetical protein
MNPGDQAADVNITYMFSDGTTKVQAVNVGAHSRVTVSVNANVPAGMDVSLAVNSSQPILVERPIYFNFQGNTTGGSDTLGFSE